MKAEKVKMKATQSRLILCDPMDCSLPGSFVYGILQARMLEWVAIPFSWDLPGPGIEPQLLHCKQILYHLSQTDKSPNFN